MRLVLPIVAMAAIMGESARPGPLYGQESPLPVTIGVSWNLVVYDKAATTGETSWGTRPAGFAAARLEGSWYLGLAATSWVRTLSSTQGTASQLSARSEASLYFVTLGYSPFHGSLSPLLRIGVGLAYTESLHGDGIEIERITHTRSALSGEATWHIRLTSHVFVAPSIAYAWVNASDPARHELRHGFSVGVGITAR